MKHFRHTASVLALTVAVAYAASVCLLSSCARRSVYTATYLDVFDTVLTVSVPARDHASAGRHAAAIHDLLLDIHRDLDIYRHYDGRTNLYDLNAAAGENPVAVSDTVMEVLTLGRDYYDRTDGQLNICLGSVLSLWHDARATNGPLPDPQAIAAAVEHSTSMGALVLDPAARTAEITDPRVSVDVGAIAKGYAMSRVLDYAKEAGLSDLLVNLGGQVLALGHHPDGQAWSVNVRDPQDPAASPRRIQACDLSVVTSGDYERTLVLNSHSYHHIIDPETGYPAARYHAVTVTVPLGYTREADALSTALFLLDIESGIRLLASVPGATAVWTATDGTVTDSQSLPTA